MCYLYTGTALVLLDIFMVVNELLGMKEFIGSISVTLPILSFLSYGIQS